MAVTFLCETFFKKLGEFQEISSQVGDLKTMAAKLVDVAHPRAADISRKCDMMESIARAFAKRVQWQKEMVRISVTFHEQLDQVSDLADAYGVYANFAVLQVSFADCGWWLKGFMGRKNRFSGSWLNR